MMTISSPIEFTRDFDLYSICELSFCRLSRNAFFILLTLSHLRERSGSGQHQQQPFKFLDVPSTLTPFISQYTIKRGFNKKKKQKHF